MQGRSSAPFRLAVSWVAANTLRWAGGIIAMIVAREGLAGSLACGADVGASQWLALRGRLHPGIARVAAKSLAWMVGDGVGKAHSMYLPDPYWAGMPGGVLAGLAQSWVLRHQVAHSWLWGLAVLVSSFLGWRAGVNAGFFVYDRPGSCLLTWSGERLEAV